MNERPNIWTVTRCVLAGLYFLSLTVLLRSTWRVGKRSLTYLRWAESLHMVREGIAFRTISAYKQISPEAYRSVKLWQLR